METHLGCFQLGFSAPTRYNESLRREENPQAEATFLSSKLNHHLRQEESRRIPREFYLQLMTFALFTRENQSQNWKLYAMITDELVDEAFEALRLRIAEAKRYPVSTYRLQFNRSFTFRNATKLLPYLHELGITDIYASPYLKARSGSLHGYDIADHNALNPEIGSQEEYESLVSQLQAHKMGQLLDFVPNHMGIFDNPWFANVLENGASSPYAGFFDIDWYPVKPELRQKALLPVLEDQYGSVLKGGQIHLTLKRGVFLIVYQGHTFPIDVKTAAMMLQLCLEPLRDNLGQGHPDYLEMQSIITACNNLPGRDAIGRERVNERQREREIVKKRLRALYQRNEEVKAALDQTVSSFNGVPGNDASFDKLHELLEAQAYRLSYWRVAWDEINYRRFFDINELIALRMEDREVFDLSHKLLRQLLREGMVTGVRVDHVDGLFDPAEYLWHLQKACFVELCWKEIELRHQVSDADCSLLEEKASQRFEYERQRNPGSRVIRPLFVVVEKILGEKERLPDGWPVDGTTGYEFTGSVNGIFVQRRYARAILNIYQRFTGLREDFRDIAYRCRRLIAKTSLSSEVSILAHQLDRVSERSREYRDFTLDGLRDVVTEVIACFPVYRTYIDAFKDFVDDRDKAVIRAAIAEAKRRNPALSVSLFDFLRDTLLLRYPSDMSEEGRNEQRRLAMRFQQLTGAVMAKGVEDTAFYIYNPLLSLSEVSGNPQRFGNSVAEFHRQNMERHRALPHCLIATSTHDSKRGEDTRARINVLSEIPDEWKTALTHWSRLNRRKKARLNGGPVPDRNEEYLIYQTLLGTYPLEQMNERRQADYQKRIQNYVLKAIKEAKVHTSWVSPNTEYEEGVARFLSALLGLSPSNSFLADFLPFNRMVVYCGMFNSLSQTLLKVFSPGTPDIYQGNELWEFSLVDPDNRRPVDFRRYSRRLKALRRQAAANSGLALLAKRLVDRMVSGDIKLYVTWKSLTYRREKVDIFDAGDYVPLEATGAEKEHICAFAWQRRSEEIIVVAPRLLAKLTQNAAIPPLGPQAWGDTRLLLPGQPKATESYRNIFTGETVNSVVDDKEAGLPLAEVFATFPVSVLEAV